MTKDIKIGIVGGDRRMLVMARELASEGCKVYIFGTPRDGTGDVGVVRCGNLHECVDNAACVILGVPYSRDGRWLNCCPEDCAVGVKALFDAMVPGRLLLGGRLDTTIYDTAEKHGVRAIDYTDRPDMAIRNALPTAEGVIQIAMRELDVTLQGCRAVVIGFGRCGGRIAESLRALGAHVSCCVRSTEARARVDSMGMVSYDVAQLDRAVENADVIINTVPCVLLDSKVLSHISVNTPVIDIASSPGGVDAEGAKEMGIRVIRALSLPGKVAPVTAGRIIKQAVWDILREEGLI